MNITHVIAVFKAEYYTTTSKFRKYRKKIPLVLLAGVFIFSYILRSLLDLIRGDSTLPRPPLSQFYSIIVLFSYFTLFAPLLSPRVIYDDSAKSKREVALSSPVSGSDLLTGNLLSNLSFYLPFFGLVSTIVLSPFIGNGIFSPLLTAVFLFGVMSLLILIGLIGGSLISPMIYFFISKQKNEISRAVVTLLVSLMLISSLPLLRFLLENVNENSNYFGFVTYLPFTVAASLIIFILYGEVIGLPPIYSLGILLLYIAIILVIGWNKSNELYSLSSDKTQIGNSNPDSKRFKILDTITRIIPQSYRSLTKIMIKASLRDLEHVSRLSIGVAVSIFMIFALSSRGLFRSAVSFPENLELGVVLFSLVLSSASVIFIEASTFTVQHRDMLSLIKSAPNGARKFVYSKAIQMFYFTLPIFTALILILGGFGFISSTNQIPVLYMMMIILSTLICISLAIYMVNPIDEVEDINNFINLLIFYIFAFIVATVPVYMVIVYSKISILFILIYLSVMLIISVIALVVASKSLDEMNLETLSSPFSSKLVQIFQGIMIFFVTWGLIPLLAINYLLITENIIGFLFLSTLLIMVLPFSMWVTGMNHSFHRGVYSHLQVLLLLIMVSFGGIIAVLSSLSNSTVSTSFSLITNSGIPNWIIYVFILLLLLVEELIFRGFLFDFLSKLNDGEKITITSLLFALTHFLSPLSFVNSLFQGVILGYSRAKSKSVIFPIVLHLIYNSFFILLLI